jgi:hypothetical protein
MALSNVMIANGEVLWPPQVEECREFPAHRRTVVRAEMAQVIPQREAQHPLSLRRRRLADSRLS